MKPASAIVQYTQLKMAKVTYSRALWHDITKCLRKEKRYPGCPCILFGITDPGNSHCSIVTETGSTKVHGQSSQTRERSEGDSILVKE
jgi:hypothetical protein